MDTNKDQRFCPVCAKRGFPETPSMLDHYLCGDCHDVMQADATELAADYYNSAED